jgi:hypothetical protein
MRTTLIAHRGLGAVSLTVLQELTNLAFPGGAMSYREAVVGGGIATTFWNEHPTCSPPRNYSERAGKIGR